MMCVDDELGCHMSGWMTQSTGVLAMNVSGSVTTPGKNTESIIIEVYVQRARKRFVNVAKQGPGRARQKS